MKKGFLLLMVLPLGLTFCGSGEQEGLSSEQEVPSSGQQALSSSFQSYVASQEALAADDYSEAGAALEKLAGDSTGDLKLLAEEAARAEDLESMRTAFIPLSDEIAKLDLPAGFVVAFCHMANNKQGANWVQKEGTIMNPYFGSAMLNCGSIVK